MDLTSSFEEDFQSLKPSRLVDVLTSAGRTAAPFAVRMWGLHERPFTSPTFDRNGLLVCNVVGFGPIIAVPVTMHGSSSIDERLGSLLDTEQGSCHLWSPEITTIRTSSTATHMILRRLKELFGALQTQDRNLGTQRRIGEIRTRVVITIAEQCTSSFDEFFDASRSGLYFGGLQRAHWTTRAKQMARRRANEPIRTLGAIDPDPMPCIDVLGVIVGEEIAMHFLGS